MANGSWQISSLGSNTFSATDLEQSAFAHPSTIWDRKVLLETIVLCDFIHFHGKQ